MPITQISIIMTTATHTLYTIAFARADRRPGFMTDAVTIPLALTKAPSFSKTIYMESIITNREDEPFTLYLGAESRFSGMHRVLSKSGH